MTSTAGLLAFFERLWRPRWSGVFHQNANRFRFDSKHRLDPDRNAEGREPRLRV